MSEITDYINSDSPSGISAVYVNLGNVGIKVYRNRDDRDNCYSLQCYLAGFGLAPKASFPFDDRDSKGSTRFCYFTDNLPFTRPSIHDIDPPEYHVWQAAADDVRNRIFDTTGIEWHDNHGGNVGRDYDGNYYCIDTDPAFCNDSTLGDFYDYAEYIDLPEEIACRYRTCIL